MSRERDLDTAVFRGAFLTDPANLVDSAIPQENNGFCAKAFVVRTDHGFATARFI